MPRRWRWLVPMTALMACAIPRAGASAAPMNPVDVLSPLAESYAAHAAQARTLRAIVTRRARHRAQASRVGRVLRTAVAQIGDGYAYGATGPDAFDCSGLTAYAFASSGVALPHDSFAQAARGEPVARRHIRRGDLVFFSTAGTGASHVGIAVSPRTVVSATNAGVMKHALNDAYWGGHYLTARRLGRSH
jgi:cell wall-associated NlpC family hydrolase